MNDRPSLSPEELRRLREDLDPIRVIMLSPGVQQRGDTVVALLQVSVYRHHISLMFGVELPFAGAERLPGPKCRIRLRDDCGGTYETTNGGLAILMQPEKPDIAQQSGSWQIQTSLAGPILPPVLDGGMSDGIYRWRVQQSLRPTLDPEAQVLHVEMEEIEIGEFTPGETTRTQKYIRLGSIPGPWVFTIKLLAEDAA